LLDNYVTITSKPIHHNYVLITCQKLIHSCQRLDIFLNLIVELHEGMTISRNVELSWRQSTPWWLRFPPLFWKKFC